MKKLFSKNGAFTNKTMIVGVALAVVVVLSYFGSSNYLNQSIMDMLMGATGIYCSLQGHHDPCPGSDCPGKNQKEICTCSAPMKRCDDLSPNCGSNPCSGELCPRSDSSVCGYYSCTNASCPCSGNNCTTSKCSPKSCGSTWSCGGQSGQNCPGESS